MLVCLPLAAPMRLSPVYMLTLCGSERVLVVSMEPPDDLSCLTTPWLSQRRAAARAVDQVHPNAHSESMLGLPTPALTCARWGVHLQVWGGVGGAHTDMIIRIRAERGKGGVLGGGGVGWDPPSPRVPL